MRYRERIATHAKDLWLGRPYVLVALGLCALVLLVIFAPDINKKPIIETATTQATERPNPTPGPAVQFTPQLPQRDADVEAAGDHIAAATAYLKNRQGAAALRAMTQARSAASRAIEVRRRQGKRVDVLEETLKGLDSAERSVQHGALNDARTRLIALNKKLDDSLVNSK
ncbi:MAG TPA: hypothetical protein VJT74_13875 [Pyrinomonadaceae bacterium]|nr:hypothetical protein [Pyrinomonadaceae bacterium]